MKKIYSLALIMFTLLSSVFFFACGNKYKDLEMKFYSSDGIEINELNLTIDKLDAAKSNSKVGVKITGIDSDEVGLVQIYSSNSNVEIKNKIYEDEFVWFDVQATSPSLSSELFVRHLDSNKLSSISLTVNKKSNNLILKNSNYIVSIPEEEEVTNEHYIKTTEVLYLNDPDSTDKVYYNVSPTTPLNGIEAITEKASDGNEYIMGFKTNKNTLSRNILIYPVVVMDGYETDATLYQNKTINVKFAKTLTSEGLNLKVDEKYLDEGSLYNPIELVYNDRVSNCMQLELDYGSVDPELYTMSLRSSNETAIVLTDLGDAKVGVQAKSYTDRSELAEIILSPNNLVGDISEVSNWVRVKGVGKADNIKVEKDGAEIEGDVVDIYDQYQTSKAYGSQFKFEPNSYLGSNLNKDFSLMRIVVSPEVLNIKTGLEGYNTIYTSNTFETELTAYQTTWKSNKFVLSVTIDNQAMRFYFDSNLGSFVSEIFDKNDDIFIKYSTLNKPEVAQLQIKVVNFYSGEITYLKDSEDVDRTISFRSQAGVTDMTLRAGYYNDNSGSLESYGDVDFENVYLNRKQGVEQIDNTTIFAQLIRPKEVLGISGVLDSGNFTITISGGTNEENSLKVHQGVLTGANPEYIGTTTLNYTYSLTYNGAIVLVFDSNTQVGEYTLTIAQEDTGFSTSLKCYVYEDISESDIYLDFETNSNAFEASYIENGEVKYYFDGYEADYIVASGESLNLNVLVSDDQFASNLIGEYVKSEIFVDGFTGKDLKDYFYSSQLNDTNNFTLNFIQGTFIEDSNRYISFTIKTTIKKYANIITEDAPLDVDKTLVFFIYETLTYEDLSITQPLNKHMYDYLGGNYINQSNATLSVTIDNPNLWNYIQNKNQKAEYEIGLNNNYNVVWIVDSSNNITTLNQDDNSLSLQFKAIRTNQALNASYVRNFTAIIYQFNNRFMLTTRVSVTRPIITQQIELNGASIINEDGSVPRNIDIKENGESSLNLKQGEVVKLNLNSVSSFGEVENKEYQFKVCNAYGIENKEAVTIDETSRTLTVNKVVSGLKLVIFAKDALKVNIEAFTSGFDDPKAMLVDFTDEHLEPLHKNAYIIIDLLLSDGESKETPYIIKTADDFWEMASMHNATSYNNAGAPFYKLVNDIDLTNSNFVGEKLVKNFNGTLFVNADDVDSDSYKIYSIYGVTLNNSNTCLFKSLYGKIEDIKFIAQYAYNFMSIEEELNLGLIDINNGVLSNVSCEINGLNTFKGFGKVYFGGLTAVNNGTIEFVDDGRVNVGVAGNITVLGSAEVYFGGLVGKNIGSVSGYTIESNMETDVSFVIDISNAGIIGNLNVYVGLSKQSSAVGGIVGLNTYYINSQNPTLNKIGTIKDIEAAGTINGIINNEGSVVNTSNIGGIVGKNIQQPSIVTISITGSNVSNLSQPDSNISNVKCYTVINGYNNIGGITGYDENGVYSNIKYQILSDVNVALLGKNNVGGIAGYAKNSKFYFCSVMSYKWDYANLAMEGSLDIVADDYVGGIVGGAESTTNAISNNQFAEILIISHSSVNAYLLSQNNAGGIISYDTNNTGVAVLKDVYFIGLRGGNNNYVSDMRLDNNNTSVVNVVYSVSYNLTAYSYIPESWAIDRSNVYYIESGNIVSAAEEDYNAEKIYLTLNALTYTKNGSSNLIINANPSLGYWDFNSNLNGGYIYVTDASTGGKPIFEVAPTQIIVEVTEKLDSDKNGIYNDEESSHYINSNTLWLNYYKFTFAESGILTTNLISELNQDYNTVKNISKFLKFTIVPSGGARLKIESSNTNILQISADGNLLVKGTGECTLTFSSRLNSGVKAVINVVITYPVGDEFKLLDNATLKNVGSTLNIPKGMSRIFTIQSVGKVAKYGDNFFYETLSNIGFNITTSCAELCYYTSFVAKNETEWVENMANIYTKDANGNYNKISVDTSYDSNSTVKYYLKNVYDDINKVINVSGLTISGNSVNVDFNTPLSISVKEFINNPISISINPYITLGSSNKNVFSSKTINVITANGPSEINLSYNSAILYPNDTTIFTAFIKTDIELNRQDLNEIINASDIIIKDNKDNIINNKYYYFAAEDVKIVTFIDVFGSNKAKVYKNGSVEIIEVFDDSVIYNGTRYKFEDAEECYLLRLTANLLTYDEDTDIQTVQFELEVLNLDTENEKRYVDIAIRANTAKANMQLTVLPQRINTIEIKNYYKDNNEYILSDILQQDKQGLIIIDMAPANGYYDYLEIVDVSGEEQILFTQVTAKDGYTLPQMDEPAQYGKGIKLIKNYTEFNNRIYIKTSVAHNYSTRVHTIMVYAFLSDGTCLTPDGVQYDIDVKMLPQITAEYRLPSGKVGQTASTEIGYDRNININLAIGTDASFYITTRESDGIITPTLSNFTDIYQFEHDNGNFYKLRYIGNGANFDSYIGKSLTLNLLTYGHLINDETTTAEVSFNIKLVHFVVHEVSISNSIDSNNISQIYGNINQDINLELYFKPTDISYYNQATKTYWDTEYRFNNSIDTVTDAGAGCTPINYINDILRELNTNLESYVEIIHTPKMELGYFDIGGEIKSGLDVDLKTEIEYSKNFTTLSGNGLKVTDVDYNKYYNVSLKVSFKLKEDTERYGNFVIDTDGIEVSKVYNISVIPATLAYEPKLIRNEEEFLSMASDENAYYILGSDLTLNNYTPLDVMVAEFDGNGRTITITSFNTQALTEEEMLLGLFKDVKEGMLVKNVNVKYSSVEESGNHTFGKVKTDTKTNDFVVESYFDACDNSTINYTSVTFGGITAKNNGVITNCNVMGEIAMRASTVEQKKFSSGGNYEINFFIGGLVGANETTGYITNSTSALRIFSQANIGGFVYENKGKIASCAVDSLIDYSDAEKEFKPALYNYNNSLEKTIVVEMAGFVVENSGEVSMSYVNLATTKLQGENFIGNMSAKDLSAGFVYNNTGLVNDAYVVMSLIGNNNNEFYGFVYTNNGSINYAYTYVNKGLWNNNVYMFTKHKTSGLTNCLEIVNYDNSYSIVSEGLNTEKIESRTDKSIYEKCHFAFGDNVSAVWTIELGSMPKLVSTLEKVLYTKNEDTTENNANPNKKYEYYYGLRNITVTISLEEDEDGKFVEVVKEVTDHSSYGTKHNPIIILDRLENGKSNWENNFTKNNARNYFRIVTDIDFGKVKTNPSTSSLTFSGNIQGNNMCLTDFMLYTEESLESIGLFKEIISSSDIAIESAIRNLTLSASSIWAAKTNKVGLLAGIVENYKLYNIHVNSNDVVVVGGNAVGGIAGIVRGNFDIQRLSSNISANSTRVSSGYQYSIYQSVNNKVNPSYNIQNVYYAGSIIGILDGYDSSSFDITKSERNLEDKYFNVQDINVYGSVVVLADSAGAAFGLVGERVYINNVNVNLTEGKIAGSQYSAGVVAENRGIIHNANVVDESLTMFNNSSYVSAGVVGLNLGGLVQYTHAKFTSIKTAANITLGGIVGRNIYGTITDSIFDGEIVAYFTGGIVGANYNSGTLLAVTSSAGAISSECKLNSNLFPTVSIKYQFNTDSGVETIANLTNTGITANAIANFVANRNNFYPISDLVENFNEAIFYSRVLGLCVGVTDVSDYVVSSYGLITNQNTTYLMFNSTAEYTRVASVGVFEKQLESDTSKVQQWPCANILDITNLIKISSANDNSVLTGTYMAYITGTIVSTFDAWDKNSYAPDMLVLSTEMDKVSAPTWTLLGSPAYLISIDNIKVENVINQEANTVTRTYTYTYVLRMQTSSVAASLTFDATNLIPNFTTSIDATHVALFDSGAKCYNVSISGTANTLEGSPTTTLTYNYVFKVV